MTAFLQALASPWSWKMAYRDGRAAKWRLALFSTSIVFGVAALVTIGSLRQNLNTAVKSQAKSLLGADIQLSARQEFSDKAKELTETLGGQQAKEISFTTMMTVGDNPIPKLVNIRGVESGFPFYGSVSTTPSNAWQNIQLTPGVLVEESFLLTMKGKLGDMVKIGNQKFPITGILNQAPPSSSGFAGITPTVVTSFDNVAKADLLSGKSLSFHKTYIKLPQGTDAGKLLNKHDETIGTERLRRTTAKNRSENIEKAINNLYIFLNLIGFSSLFLGGIGIAGAIHIHISERLRSVATLRCLGCTTATAFAIYFIQGACMGLFGTLLGLAVGCGLVFGIASLTTSLPDVIPFAIEISPVISEVLKAGLVGFIICICFALLPLLSIRTVSPLAALRQGETAHQAATREPLRWLIILALAGTAYLLAWYDNQQMKDGVKTAIGYVGFLVIAFSLLLAAGLLLRWILKLLVRPSWPLAFRQGFSALYRPNNQTSIFMLSIGLGVFFLFTLLLTQNILLQWLSPERLSNKPNIFMVDVPPEDIEKAKELIASTGAKPLANAPIIQLRMMKIKGVPVEEFIKHQAKNRKQANNEPKIPRWILRRSFRCTYRSEPSTTEKLTKGEWVPFYDETSKAVPISIEEEIAGNLGLKLGDTITMEIEGFGEELTLKVASMREVDWRSMNLNFFIVFPDGPIKDYVAFDIQTAHSPNAETTAALQQEMFKQWPTVNVIDLSLILKTVQAVLSASGKTIQMMALFTIITGSIVLVSSILSGRRVRIKESTLLRTLGASQAQIARILAIEYTLLALLATTAGSGLAAGACLLLGQVVFESEPYTFPWLILITGSSIVIVVTVSLGMLLSRGIAKTPPMQAIKASQ